MTAMEHALSLVPLCTAELRLAPPIDLGGAPTGRRMVAEIVAADLTGERLNARMVGRACADWYTNSAHSRLGIPDVRITLETADGAFVLMRYSGRMSTPTGRAAGATAYVAPTFETGDDRYEWLNHVQAVARGDVSGNAQRISYSIYELR